MRITLTQAVIATALAHGAAAAPWGLPEGLNELATGSIEAAQRWWSSSSSERVLREGLEVGSLVKGDINYLTINHPAYPTHQLRIVEPKICDPDIHQISGYLDVSDKHHFFFWFQGSRRSPKSDPLVLWLNGGPGCSSLSGLLFEQGACSMSPDGTNITYNPHSWSNVANMIYLDQPTGAGYSYSDDGKNVNNSPDAAQDVLAFLSLFVSQFTEYAKLDFHIAGESYAGTYIPYIASAIHKYNQNLGLAPVPGKPKINLQSLLIGNGLTDAYNQYPSTPVAACQGAYAVFEPGSSQCISMEGKVGSCVSGIKRCHQWNSKLFCTPAEVLCWSIYQDLQQSTFNLYDVRRQCDRREDADGPLCYKQYQYIEKWYQQPEIMRELGADPTREYHACDMSVNQGFLLAGDVVHDTPAELLPLIADGIRVLLYAGMADMMVNYIGCAAVLDNLQTAYSAEYADAKIHNFTDISGSIRGYTKSAGKGAGNVAFVAFKNAGHMVPHDDPEGSLAMLSRWVENKPLTAKKGL